MQKNKIVAPTKVVDNKIVNETKSIFSNEILNKLNSIDIKENVSHKADFLYKFQLEENKLNDKQSKQKRVKFRNELQRITDNIFIYAKLQQLDKLKAEKENLINFQKNNLISTELNVRAFYHGSNEKRVNELNVCFEILNALETK